MPCCTRTEKIRVALDLESIDGLKQVIEECRVVFLLFYTESCGVCRAFMPVYDIVAEAYRGDAAFLKVNANRFYELAVSLGVMSVPSTIVVIDGRLAGFFSGFIDEDRLFSVVEKALEYAECKSMGGA